MNTILFTRTRLPSTSEAVHAGPRGTPALRRPARVPVVPTPVHLLRRERQLRLVPGEEVFVEGSDSPSHVFQPIPPPLLRVPLPRVPADPHRV